MMSSVHTDKDKDKDCCATVRPVLSAPRQRRSSAHREELAGQNSQHRGLQDAQLHIDRPRDLQNAQLHRTTNDFENVPLGPAKRRASSFTESERSLIRGVLQGGGQFDPVPHQDSTQSTTVIEVGMEKMSISTPDAEVAGTTRDDDWVDVEEDVDENPDSNPQDDDKSLYDDLSALMDGTSKIVQGGVIVASRLWRLAGRGVDRFVNQKP